MYRQHFRLKALPFENVPDPRFFFGKGDYQRVLERMTDSLAAGRGLLVIAGPIGSGKTTLCQKLKSDLPKSSKVVWIAEPPGSSSNLFLFLAQELGIDSPSPERAFVLRDIRRRLLETSRGGDRSLMIIDEAHLMSDDELEGVRLLNNLEEDAAKLIQIILLGQDELTESLSRPELEPFRQRIAGMEVIGRMDSDRVREYVLHRLHVAGDEDGVFTESAVEAVTLSSGGIPRVTNTLCNRAMRISFERGKSVVDIEDLHRAANDLGLGRATLHSLLRQRALEKSTQKESGEGKGGESEGKGERTEKSPARRKEGRDLSAGPRKEPSEPGLRGPLLVLLLSVVSFSASLWVYCERFGGGNCIEALIRSFL